jgi:tetratricopeptide (TPR) repeat protein
MAVMAAAEDAAEFGTWAEQVSAGAVTVERLRQHTRQLARAALLLPPQVVVAQVAALSRDVFALARGHHRPAQSRDLYLICAQMCSVMAWLAGDLGQLDAAELQGRTAWACADLAEDPQTSAWVLVVQSKTAFWRGDYRRAADLARRGASLDPSGTGALMLACQQAATALHDAATAAEQIRGSDHIGGLLSCDDVRHANYAAAVHLRAGESELALREADRALTQAATTGGGHGFGTIAQIHLTRAFAHAQADRIEAAAQAARPVLDLPPERRLATLSGRLRTLTAVLDRPGTHGNAVAGLLHEEITAFCGAPTGRPKLTDTPRQEDDR